jgi:hypothetical protein
MTPILLVVAAGVIWLWPAKSTPSPTLSVQTQDVRTPIVQHPSYHASLMAMSTVRQRLLQTERLDEKCRSAIDSLVLALVSGSDQP